MAFLSLPLWAASINAAENSTSQNAIEKVDFATLPGDKVNIKITLSQPLKNPPAGFSLTDPARIALDFPDTVNALQKNSLSVGQGVLRSVSFAQAKGRTRMVLNLTKPSSYTSNVSGNEVNVELQTSGVAAAGGNASSTVTRFAEAKIGEQRHSISNVDFMRGKNGEGRVVVDLSDNATGIDIRQQGQKILIDFINADITENLQRRLNVTDFATPVLNVDTVQYGKNVRMTIEPKGLWEHSAYQADRKFIVDVRPLVEDPNKLIQGSKQGYKGEKLSLNFQNIEVRSVLQVIADFTGFNIITGDNVSGNITLRLKDVPWDQALDIIMQTRGLGMRKNGNVIWIAPNEELAAKEKSRLDAELEIADREPLVTQSFAAKYQKAADLKTLISDSKQSMLSKRGSAVVDVRSNTLFVQDTEKNLAKIEKIINQIDIPVRQVLIEGRIVLADDGFSKELGAKFGFVGNRDLGVGTSPSNSGISTGNTVSNIYNNHINQVSVPTDLNVNLPATSGNASSIGFQIYNIARGFILNLELSAAEADNKTKTISSPKVITGNQQKAVIESGVEIPYQEASSSGATSVSFKKATLGLEVTPQITPDNKVNMDLLVKKDSRGDVTNGVPAINTNRVETKVLVDNGETAVLGGIFEETTTKSVDKVPFFGDLPVLGYLFKRTLNATDKNELLIFITPRLLDDTLKAD
ncbi:type IV pilus secretin PilQ [Methylobacillus sp. MM3]|uniref:type IV pilus secretin PilQ n=1 Tax=Methylobacillus sp. MM3 TaxID=1848039 RepID=UPI001F0A2893|nr:type IV pilus secretin PilQ [Methylobacillus sp. MM3]